MSPSAEMLHHERERARAQMEWERVTAKHRTSHRRRRAVAVTVALLVVVGGAGIWRSAFTSIDDARRAQTRDVAGGVEVVTDVVRFTMPGLPTKDVTQLTEQTAVEMWHHVGPDLMLQVASFDFVVDMPDALLERLIDETLESSASAASGAVVSEQPLDHPGARAARAAIVDSDVGYLYVNFYVIDHWLVMVSGANFTDQPPAEFDDLVASLEIIGT